MAFHNNGAAGGPGSGVCKRLVVINLGSTNKKVRFIDNRKLISYGLLAHEHEIIEAELPSSARSKVLTGGLSLALSLQQSGACKTDNTTAH